VLIGLPGARRADRKPLYTLSHYDTLEVTKNIELNPR
jgi:hypothetical protein